MHQGRVERDVTSLAALIAVFDAWFSRESYQGIDYRAKLVETARVRSSDSHFHHAGG